MPCQNPVEQITFYVGKIEYNAIINATTVCPFKINSLINAYIGYNNILICTYFYFSLVKSSYQYNNYGFSLDVSNFYQYILETSSN
jgi:hypothetical protein